MSDTPKNYESDTPETCEAVERWQQGKINIFDEMARLERERDEARETITRLNRRLTKAEGIITAAELVENRPKSGGGSLGRALANYAAEQWKDIAERSIGYVYDNDWDPEACDIIKDYEKLAGGPHPIHSK